ITSISFSQEINIIPKPASIELQKGYLTISPKTKIIATTDNVKLLSFINDYLLSTFGYKLPVSYKLKDKGIKLITDDGKNSIQNGGYKMYVNKEGITISGNSEGLFRGITTLLQLFPTERKMVFPVNFCIITDYPRFDYRGIHLDACRHFWPVDFIKKYIDYLALHKFNTFHWHLTDDQGWRIEIKKYPKLTSVGGWRNGTIIGRYPGTGNDNIRYGGYYTQEQVKVIVKYAADRYITVIPEIEMPGHSSAAIAAFPELSCFPDKPTDIPSHPSFASQLQHRIPTNPQDSLGYKTKLVQETWGVFNDVFCAGKENTFNFLEGVMDEVLSLFPSKYVHVGGDESPKENWKLCTNCQKRIKDNNLKDEHELQSYFIQRMEKYLNGKGKTVIGWDEILEGGLAPNAVVMSWRGEAGGIEAAKQKHNVIMTPGNPVYFDHSQSENEDSLTIGGYNPIEKVYAYEPIPKELSEEEGKYILGAQANMWTEYIDNTKKVEYMLLPRLSALSEVLWSPKEKRNWDDFEKRLQSQFNRYELWKLNYSKAYYDLKATVLPSENNIGILWKLESKNKKYQINYNKIFDINDPPNPPAFYSYTAPVQILKNGEYAAWTTDNGKHMQNTIIQHFSFSKATGKKITLKSEPSKSYPGDGAFTLVNGVQNKKGTAKSKEFLGFSGTDCEAVIDLGKVENISNVTVHCLHQKGSWIWRPATVEVQLSTDGIKFSFIGLTDDFNPTIKVLEKGNMKVEFSPTQARFVKIVIKNWGEIPVNNPGEGKNAWLFVDEIEIE
ncbi:MAG: family 20 glycosylhydrolase, partial [Chitinophagaceae bacterium]